MNGPDLYPIYRGHLRSAMKAQGMNYAELGRRVGLSESGIKKVFAANDISLTRLNQLCDALDLPLAELVAIGNDSMPEPLELSPEAEAYLLKDRATFRLFFLLLTEPKSFREIVREHKVPQDQARQSLIHLERLKLIERHPGDRVVVKVRPALFKSGGALVHRLVREWSLELVKEMLPFDGQQQPNDVKILRLLYLLPQSQQDLQAALAIVARDFTARAFRERKIHGKKSEPVRLLILSREGHFVRPQ
jgi:transcriptional regulator with XRE-family HTH domain